MNSGIKYCSIAFVAVFVTIGAACTAQKAPDANTAQKQMPLTHNMSNMSHSDEVNQRGDQVMGFDHAKTTHHFRLLSDGGAIEVEANDANDTASRDHIRQHLGHISEMFADGNFNAPMLIHGREPDGVPTMQRLKAEIKYQYEETDKGGRVRISSGNPEAVNAVREFLRFQTNDHRTGDPTDVEK